MEKTMSEKHPQPGLDQRHRDVDGEISRKHGNTQVGTLRQTYGTDFAAGSDMKLSTLLDQSGAPSLRQYLKRSR
jgi:hypothetical protein